MTDRCKENKHPEIWINLLNPGSMEELGKAVYQALMKSSSECKYVEGEELTHRHIEVTGS